MPDKIKGDNSYPVDFTEEEVIEYCKRLGIDENLWQFVFDRNYDQLWQWFPYDHPFAAMYFKQVVAADAVLRIFTWNPILLHEVYFLLKSAVVGDRLKFDGYSRRCMQPETSLPIHSVDIYFDLFIDEENKVLGILDNIFDQFENLSTRNKKSLSFEGQLRIARARVKNSARRFCAAHRADFPEKPVQCSLRNPPLLLQKTSILAATEKPLLQEALPRLPKALWDKFDLESSSYLDILSYKKSRPLATLDFENQNTDVLLKNMRGLIKQQNSLKVSGWSHYPTLLAEVIKLALMTGENTSFFKLCEEIVKTIFLIDNELTWFGEISTVVRQNSKMAALVATGQEVSKKSKIIPHVNISPETEKYISCKIHHATVQLPRVVWHKMADGTKFVVESRLQTDVIKDLNEEDFFKDPLINNLYKIFVANFDWLPHQTEADKKRIFKDIMTEQYGTGIFDIIHKDSINGEIVGFNFAQIASEMKNGKPIGIHRDVLVVIQGKITKNWGGLAAMICNPRGWGLGSKELRKIEIISIFEGARWPSIILFNKLAFDNYPFDQQSQDWVPFLKEIYHKIYSKKELKLHNGKLLLPDDSARLENYRPAFWKTLGDLRTEDMAADLSQASQYTKFFSIICAFKNDLNNLKIFADVVAGLFANSNKAVSNPSELSPVELSNPQAKL